MTFTYSNPPPSYILPSEAVSWNAVNFHAICIMTIRQTAEIFTTFRSSDLYLAMCSVAFVSVTDVVWLSWANIYPSKYLQVPGSCVSFFRMEPIYIFDANIVIIVKFTYLSVFTYLLISSWMLCLQCTFFITGIFNKSVLTAQITYGG